MSSSNPENEEPKYTVLVSSDGFEFIIKRSAACTSKVVKNMLDRRNNLSEARENRIKFDNISAAVLEKVCEYWCYSEKYKDTTNVPEMHIPPELAFVLLEVADYLQT